MLPLPGSRILYKGIIVHFAKSGITQSDLLVRFYSNFFIHIW